MVEIVPLAPEPEDEADIAYHTENAYDDLNMIICTQHLLYIFELGGEVSPLIDKGWS